MISISMQLLFTMVSHSLPYLNLPYMMKSCQCDWGLGLRSKLNFFLYDTNVRHNCHHYYIIVIK